MTTYLAFLCGRLFIFFFDLCGRLNYDMAFNLLKSMWDVIERNKKIDITQENFRKVMKK